MKIYRNRRRIEYWLAAVYLKKAIPELKDVSTDYIESHLKGTKMLFFEEETIPVSLWIRLTLPFFTICLILLFIGLPINFIITGKWGYKWEWFYNWLKKLGF